MDKVSLHREDLKTVIKAYSVKAVEFTLANRAEASC